MKLLALRKVDLHFLSDERTAMACERVGERETTLSSKSCLYTNSQIAAVGIFVHYIK
jgi:hypothetical protein